MSDLPIIANKQTPEIITLASDIETPKGELVLYQNFWQKSESDRLLKALLTEIDWRQDKIKMFGKEIDLPRLTAWYGDPGKSYQYSGIKMNPKYWTATLLDLKKQVDLIAKSNFNSVLINLYRTGKDSMAWHSDDEPELGNNPTIVSVSFGATRRFVLRHKYNKNLAKIEMSLSHGSLLIMRGTTQHYWQHQIPKTAKKITPRLNLTFRIIM